MIQVGDLVRFSNEYLRDCGGRWAKKGLRQLRGKNRIGKVVEIIVDDLIREPDWSKQPDLQHPYESETDGTFLWELKPKWHLRNHRVVRLDIQIVDSVVKGDVVLSTKWLVFHRRPGQKKHKKPKRRLTEMHDVRKLDLATRGQGGKTSQ